MIFVNDSGLELVLETDISLAVAILTQVAWKSPSGLSGTWNGSPINGTQILYTTQPGNLNEVGRWELQAKVTFLTKVVHGKKVTVQVDNVTN